MPIYAISVAKSDQLRLVYSGKGMISLTSKPQGVLGNLICRGVGPVLEVYSLVEILPRVGDFTMRKHVVSGGEQKIPLAGCAEPCPEM